ncbi:12566_t:CDS:2 [Cetraspora pellucida]|uniref:12566_t:CDS:1 n=1 Tax=Cetraspora pellucida TaxID=1433469 RepID=A0ACA9KTK0_9GLOM|nr:12566_t:CDS:2 [Cetraspora pellucida]
MEGEQSEKEQLYNKIKRLENSLEREKEEKEQLYNEINRLKSEKELDYEPIVINNPGQDIMDILWSSENPGQDTMNIVWNSDLTFEPLNALYYIALGDSFAAGVDISGPYPGNKITPSYSYANAFHKLLKKHGKKHTNLKSKNFANIKLKKFARSGETSDGLIANQLTNATNFMKSNPGSTKLVTITIGKNDFNHCFPPSKPSNLTECLDHALNHLVKNLNKKIIPSLKEAGGEGVQYAATTYYNYFSYFKMLDDKLVSLYVNNGFEVIDINHIITDDMICDYTHWCGYKDWHPNSNGGRAIARLLFRKLHYYKFI